MAKPKLSVRGGNAKITFKTDRIFTRNTRLLNKAMTDVSFRLNEDFNRKLATPYPPASKPGNVPHKRTGNLQGSTTAENKGRQIIVRTTDYGVYLETGTSKMKARPFIFRNILGADGKRFERLMDQAIKRNKKG